MSNIEKLTKEIKELEQKINSGVFKGQQYQIAMDMLSDKKCELDRLNAKKVVTPVVNAPIKGLKEPKSNVTSVQMTGGMRM